MLHRKLAVLLPLLFVVPAVPVNATQADSTSGNVSAPTSTKLGALGRREVVTKLSNALRDRYVFPKVGEQAAARINAALAAGDYETLADPVAFAARLSTDVSAIAHDKHLTVLSKTAPPAPASAPGEAPPKSEAGVVRADQLTGGVGYIEVTGFPPQQFFKPVLDKAMSSLAGSRALIIDVRRNFGGSPESVAYLVSFLLAPGRPINDIVSRVEKTGTFTRQSYSSIATPVTFAEVPVYVLTSKSTFSGGEEFAYDIQALKRGVLMGEVTGGGANPTGMVDLGHNMSAMIPFGRAENPVTKNNWEGHGVRPDFAVPAKDALRAALERAGEKPVGEITVASTKNVFAPRSTPLPGSEAALRQLIAGYASGEPDYVGMTPEMAATTRKQLRELKNQFSPLGELRSLKFRGPDMLGGDEYELHFAAGARTMALVLGPDGKIIAASGLAPLSAER